MIKLLLVAALGCCCGLFSFFAAEVASFCNQDIKTQIVVIEGKVSLFEPESGMTFIPAEGHQLIFQRVDCKKCLSVTFTDKNGNYRLIAGQGKYRLIVKEDISKGGSSIDPNQTDIVDANSKVTHNIFDIKLVRHKDSSDIPFQILSR